MIQAKKFLIETDDTPEITVVLCMEDDATGSMIKLSKGDARMLASILNSAANTVGETNAVTVQPTVGA